MEGVRERRWWPVSEVDLLETRPGGGEAAARRPRERRRSVAAAPARERQRERERRRNQVHQGTPADDRAAVAPPAPPSTSPFSPSLPPSLPPSPSPPPLPPPPVADHASTSSTNTPVEILYRPHCRLPHHVPHCHWTARRRRRRRSGGTERRRWERRGSVPADGSDVEC